MSQDKELEIRLQFLDEAQEYLSTLESAIMGLTNGSVDIDRINAALRAAHSIKGGAGMMGYLTLSALAHQLEDSFKVLKIQRHAIQIDGELEGLLLSAVDCLNWVIECDRQTSSPGGDQSVSLDPQWLETRAQPIFEQLHQCLGDPQEEDANSILAPEEGQDIVRLLFETEVDGCLQRLETVLLANDPCLREEVEILAQELGGLGEMLQLAPFAELCQSVAHYVTAAPERAEEIGYLALETWRRSQALVLVGQLELLPSTLDGIDIELPAIELLAESATASFDLPVEHLSLDFATEGTVEPSFVDEVAQSDAVTQSLAAAMGFDDWEVPNSEESSLSQSLDTFDRNGDIPHSSTTASSTLQTVQHEIQRVEAQLSEVSSEPTLPTTKEVPDSTVRVPCKQLDQLNDLFGELTIERNALDLHLKRLRNLMSSLQYRVQVLEQSNAQLRDAYDRDATQSSRRLSPLAASLMLSSVTAPDNGSTNVSGGFDALEMDRYSDRHSLSQEMMETIVQIQEVATDIELSLDDSEQTARNLNKTSRQLQTKLTKVRMRPLSDITDRFPRALRELSLQYGKSVQLKVQGANTLVDRNILEALNDPLMHLIRNAFDHGIEDRQTRVARGKAEEGVIEIRATHTNSRTIITIRDDGGGIPLDKIRARARQMGLDEVLLAAASDDDLLSLIFEPGFSTSEQVTTLSGRGVGMDVVRDRLKQIQGEIKVDTQPGLGTTFTLSVPFTLTVTRVLIAESNGMLMAFPIDVVEEMLLLPSEQILTTAGSEAFNWQGLAVQLVRLGQWIEFNCPRQLDGMETPAAVNVPTVLLVSPGNQLVGIQIDRSWGEQEVAVRKVEGSLPMPPGFSNCTILGDGRVVPLVSISDLLRWIASCERAKADADSPTRLNAALTQAPRKPSATPPVIEQQPTVLVVDDSVNVRRFLALTLEKAGYQVAQAKDGQDALDKLTAGLQVQAIICDIEMPRLDGYGFLARLKANPTYDQTPIAMLTSRSGEKHKQLAMNLGATAYFSKPYNEQVLLQALENMLGLTQPV